jgi:hypothetical protein
MGKGGENVKSEKTVRKISVEELAKHRTMDDGKKCSFSFPQQSIILL